jgi:hypothetical protein
VRSETLVHPIPVAGRGAEFAGRYFFTAPSR